MVSEEGTYHKGKDGTSEGKKECMECRIFVLKERCCEEKGMEGNSNRPELMGCEDSCRENKSLGLQHRKRGRWNLRGNGRMRVEYDDRHRQQSKRNDDPFLERSDHKWSNDVI